MIWVLLENFGYVGEALLLLLVESAFGFLQDFIICVLSGFVAGKDGRVEAVCFWASEQRSYE